MKIFISYSRKDIEIAGKVQQELVNKGFNVWRDTTDIKPVANWPREIAYNLASSDIVVLIWSSNTASSVNVRHEWLTAKALEKGIIPCYLEHLSKLPAEARLPHVLENINGIHFDDFEKGMETLLNTLNDPSIIKRTYEYMQLPPHSFIPFRPNSDFIGRQTELLELYLKIIEGLNNVVGINQVVGAFGLGGIGKTQLAVEFAYRFAFAFPDGVLWLNAARDWKTEFVSLAHRLGLNINRSSSDNMDEELLEKLQGFISEHKSMLLVMDNVADPLQLNDEIIVGFVPTTLGCSLLFTSRSPNIPPGAKACKVDTLHDDAAYHLLTSGNLPTSEVEKVSAQKICRMLGNLPLAIEMIKAYLRKKGGVINYETYLQNLTTGRLKILEGKSRDIRLVTHDPSITAIFESQYQLLEDENAKYIFKLAGQFPEAEIIPMKRLGLLAGIEDHPERLETHLQDAFKELFDTSIMEQLRDNQVRLHPLVWEFARDQVPEDKRASLRSNAAGQLQHTYDDVLRLGKEFAERGIDSIIEDIKVGAEWSENASPCYKELTGLYRLIDGQRHNLRWETPEGSVSERQAQLFQQLHYEAQYMGMPDIARKFLLTTSAKTAPFFKVCSKNIAKDPSRLRTFKGHSNGVNAVSLSSDGKRVISASRDKTLILWDVESGEPIRTFKGHSYVVNAVSISNDGKRAISSSLDKTLILWDVESGKPIHTFNGHSHGVNAVSLSNDGKRVISASRDNTLILWDVESGEPIRAFKGHSDGVNAVSLSSDGKRAISGSLDKTLILWDVESGEPIRTLKGHSSSVVTVSLSSDGKRAISGSWDKTLILWDVESGEPIRAFKGHSSVVDAVSLSSDGKRAISGSLDNTLILWDVESGEPIRAFKGHSGGVNAVSLSSDGKRAISGSLDNTLILWDVESGESVHNFKGHSSSVVTVSLSSDGKRVISASWDKTLILWDVESGEPIRAFKGHSDGVNAVSLSSDGKRAISGSWDNTLILWDVESGEPIRIFRGHSSSVGCLSLSSDGKRAISGSWDKTLILWDVESGEPVRTFKGQSSVVTAVSISSDGKRAISGSWDKTLILWDVESGEPIRAFKGHSYGVNAVSLSSDGKRAISGSWDNTLILWDVESGEPIRVFKGHSDTVDAVSLSSDGKRAISGSRDKTLILWDVENGKVLRRLYVESWITSLSWSKDKLFFGDMLGQVQSLQIIG